MKVVKIILLSIVGSISCLSQARNNVEKRLNDIERRLDLIEQQLGKEAPAKPVSVKSSEHKSCSKSCKCNPCHCNPCKC